MLIRSDPPLHLTYCLNIHPGESWAENFAAIRRHTLRVRDAVSPGAPFGLGLRLSYRAASTLREGAALAEFKAFLADNDLYVFTINGFPYGTFHGTEVKQNVYSPDWRTPERRDYTLGLIDILAALLPEGVSGSISTVPGAYGTCVRGPEDVEAICCMLAETAAHAAAALRETQRDICIALEPEPDCFIENTDEAVRFFTETLPDSVPAAAQDLGASEAEARRIVGHHLGLCLDTAHAAVQFERPSQSLRRLRSANIRIGKIQLSSALRLRPVPGALERLGDFADPVYLHQARLRSDAGDMRHFGDLAEAIAAARESAETDAELRVHFHVPLFFTEAGGLESTGSLLDDEFWRLVTGADAPGGSPTEQLEIETYTFDVLPDDLRSADVVESIVREYEWVLERCRPAGRRGPAAEG